MDTASISSASGTVDGRSIAGRLNVHAMRPFLHKDGPRIMVNEKQSIRTNAPALLQYDEWKDIDRTVQQVAVDRLVAVGDLISKGLVHTIGSIGQTISLWDRQSDMTPANVDMSGVTPGEEDKLAYETAQVPIPIVHKDFRINIRHLEASRVFGSGIDVQSATTAARLVAEKTEDMLFSGNAIQVDGATIYGYLTHPHRNTVDLVAQWDASGTTGEDIVEDVQAMLAAARADNFYGPFVLYVPGGYEHILDNDYSPASGDTRTIRQRIMQLNGIADVKVADRLTAHNVVLVQLTSDVVDMAIARDITTVQWQVDGGMQERFKVMAVWAPRIKSDFDGKSGVVHLRAA